VRMNPSDLPRRGLNSGDLVKLRSRRGTIVLPLLADERVSPMQIDIPMHWGEEFVSGTTPEGEVYAGVNSLTNGAFCPDSKQPELKYAAVAVERADLPWRLWVAGWVDDGREATLRQALRAHMKTFGYAACVPVKGPGDKMGVMFQAASATAISPAQVKALSELLSLKGSQVLSYTDPRRGQRQLQLVGEGDSLRLNALLLVGTHPLSEGLWNLWLTESPIADPRELLRGDGCGSAPIRKAARQVCNCFDVSEPRIRECYAQIKGKPAYRIAELQSQLKCGTSCGSCLPELRRLEREVVALPE
jgi:assimilatory nitrate reductase catalytic subunit